MVVHHFLDLHFLERCQLIFAALFNTPPKRAQTYNQKSSKLLLPLLVLSRPLPPPLSPRPLHPVFDYAVIVPPRRTPIHLLYGAGILRFGQVFGSQNCCH
jgi:hypothetical protein